MKKPDWNRAPKWANYLAMDKGGEWFWYENKPDRKYDHWYSDEGDVEIAIDVIDWKTSLGERP